MNALLEGKSNIFQEIKNMRGKTSRISSRIDGHVGSTNIADHFSEMYGNLYNKSNLGEDFNDMVENIKAEISDESIFEVDKIDVNLIKTALQNMKAGKTDVIFDFSSDLLINGPEILLEHIVNLFKTFLIHGKFPVFLLTCSLLPIIKDNLGDLANSDNYRAIAKSALLLKLFDWIILLTQEDKLTTDQLQFGYQKLSSTVMCSWVASTVISQFNKSGNDVYGCLMDCSKAFDMVEWVKLFQELMKKGVSAIYLRLLLFLYENQQCDVQWNGKHSKKFPVKKWG